MKLTNKEKKRMRKLVNKAAQQSGQDKERVTAFVRS